MIRYALKTVPVQQTVRIMRFTKIGRCDRKYEIVGASCYCYVFSIFYFLIGVSGGDAFAPAAIIEPIEFYSYTGV